MYHHTSEWASVVSLDSIQHEQSYFEVGLGVQLSLDWNGIGKVSFDRNLGVQNELKASEERLYVKIFD